MWNYPEEFDVIVVGAGHAGCEAAYAASKMGAKALLLTTNLDTIAKMSCNPSIGGTAKGHIVREIDALGGIMGKIADRSAIHARMLNESKGPAVRSPRAQADKLTYHFEMKHFLERCENLELKQGTVEKILVENNIIKGVETLQGISYLGKNLIIASGTFMNGEIHIGQLTFPGGRMSEMNVTGLPASLKEIGLNLTRLKTGTPPRVHRRSIDFSKVDPQKGDDDVVFSYDEKEKRLPQQNCYITYTTDETKKIILYNLKESALFSGKIKGVGPRYCPSIEDKMVRFSDKERHQIFLEPEGLNTEEFYLNGLSSSMPFSVQLQVIRSVKALERAEILRPAYAIEYDALIGQISATLESKAIEGLFLAGQINGTTGYEEAAGQGLMAGINAACKVLRLPPFILSRSESYIGVMIDDLITKQIDEPYRMFTSRAEYRLLLRQDNADLRLRPYGYKLGLIDSKRFEKVQWKQNIICKEIERLSKTFKQNTSFSQLLSRPGVTYNDLLRECGIIDHGKEVNEQIELELKYAGYLIRQKKEVEKLQDLEKVYIPKDFSFSSIPGLRREAKEKLTKFAPSNLSAASRLSGVSPADLSILLVALKR